ncbi:P80 family lipoprotein [Mycoplasma iguanae]|uniref:P80 family lipoprotein n=1 Tax=Mycoplasma iguanae TaxID=292461 RepID=A0ABY5RAS7_9MOLU|nr:P80 family lipoprotein [Mycoplasma iguanae]UVD81720.1 P80 family lipoprotein [Mycoplasma iguanae]
MKNKLNLKKLIGVAGATTLASAFILASCAPTVSKFDQSDDKKMKFALTITAPAARSALNDIIQAYNEQSKSDYKWEQMEIQGGYQGLDNVLKNKLPAKDKDGLFNVALNYPSALAIARRYDMGLAFDKSILNLDELFDESFLQVNKNMVNVKENEQWTIPMNKSVEMLTINMPMFKYVLEKANDSSIAEDSKEFFDKIKAVGETDQEFIGKVMGTYTPTEEGLKGYVFKKEVFESYSALIDLANRITVAFPNAQKAKSNGTAREILKNVFGIDSPANAIYSSAFSKAGGDYEKFLFHLNKEKTGVDFSSVIKNPDSEEYKLLKLVFEEFKKGFDKNALFIKSVSTYSSNYLKQHQLIFAIGSTAGYRHNFAPNTDEKLAIIKKPAAAGTTAAEESITLDGSLGEILVPTEAEKTNNPGLIATVKGGNYTNKIYASDTRIEPRKRYTHDIFLTSAKEDEEIKNLLKDKNPGEAVALLGRGEPYSMFQLIGAVNKPTAGEDTRTKTYLISQSSYSIITQGANEKLNEKEILNLPAPKLFQTGDTEQTLVQGPSLIALHSNENENAETQKFVKWMLTESRKWTWTTGSGERVRTNEFTGTGAEYFAFRAGYIIPTKENLKQLENKTDTLNPANKITFQSLKSATVQPGETKAKTALLEDPVSANSSTFREAIQKAMETMNSRASNGQFSEISFDKFLESVKIQLPNSLR